MDRAKILGMLKKCDLVDLILVFCYVTQDDHHDDLVIGNAVVGGGVHIRSALYGLIQSYTDDEISEAIEHCGIEGNYE